jgi:hypothetical protein
VIQLTESKLLQFASQGQINHMVLADMTKLDDLIQEVIEFSNLIGYSENPADPDLQNACRLFSTYLDTQLKQIRRAMIGTPAAIHSRWTASELSQLSELIDRPKHSTELCIQWIRDLFQHCIALQRGRQVAA